MGGEPPGGDGGFPSNPMGIEPSPRVAVVGAGRASAKELSLAEALGWALGQGGATVITGGLGGVMEAVSRGCAQAGGSTVGILPGVDPRSANPWVQLPLPTGLGEGRNLLVVRSGQVVVAVSGGWGTLSEVALARKIGREVVLLGEPTLGLDLSLPRTEDPAEAASWALARAMPGS